MYYTAQHYHYNLLVFYQVLYFSFLVFILCLDLFVSPPLAVPAALPVAVLANATSIKKWQSKGSLTRTNQPADRGTEGEERVEHRVSQDENDEEVRSN